MKNFIEIRKNATCYMASIYENGVLVVEAPTPFTVEANVCDVIESLAKLNPNFTFVIK